MKSSNTACPLDCYDACEVIYEEDKLKAQKSGHTQGFLCPHLNHYEKHKQIHMPTFMQKEISMQEALVKLKEILLLSKKEEILHYRGSGNFGLMQEVSDHFFASFGATLTDGTLCDGAGEAGIMMGRGSNKNMPLLEIAKSEVVIIWGRNPHATSSHLLPLIKDKTLIVIDPIQTQIAKIADLHIQIKPHADIYLAMLLCRFLHIESGYDKEFLEEYASEHEEFYELTQSIRIKATLESMDVTLGQIGKILEYVKEKRVAIVCGVGIQKYSDGADVLRAIDAFAVMLGLFGKEGCGVAYLGNSKEGISSPFKRDAKRVSKVNTEFSNYKTVFIQGANPLSQMPNSSRVHDSLSQVSNIIYFGLYENETSQMAHLVLPAKNFLCKNDIRTSYSHNAMLRMHQVADSDFGISEYDLSAYLCGEFNIALDSEAFYLNHFESFREKVEHRDSNPYKEGFDTKNKEFAFLEELEIQSLTDSKLFLLTPKSSKSLNSQFMRDEFVYLHPSLDIAENEEVCVTSACGSVTLRVKHCDAIRKDCVLIYSGTKGVNNLTTSKHSLDGKCAIFQEEKVEIKMKEKEL